MTTPPFHLALAVDDLSRARAFYGGVFGCREGRSSDRWIDFDFFGHQLVVHLVAPAAVRAQAGRNRVDGDDVPAPHFGVVLAWEQWEHWRDRLAAAGVAFVVPPRVRFAGRVGEQATLFVRDPAGNALELKAMRDPAALFTPDPGPPPGAVRP